MTQLVGYARVSTRDQNPDLQIDALQAAGCTRIFTEQASSVKERPQLAAAIDYLREGDTLVFWKLDRLGRSLKELIHTLDTFQKRGIGVKCLTQPIDTTSQAGAEIAFVCDSAAGTNLLIDKDGLARDGDFILPATMELDRVPAKIEAVAEAASDDTRVMVRVVYDAGLFEQIGKAKTVALLIRGRQSLMLTWQPDAAGFAAFAKVCARIVR